MQIVVVGDDPDLRDQLPVGMEWALDPPTMLERLMLAGPTQRLMFGVESMAGTKIKTETFTSVKRTQARAVETAETRAFMNADGSGQARIGPFDFNLTVSRREAAVSERNRHRYRFRVDAEDAIGVESGLSWTQIGLGAREVLRDLVLAMDASFACVVHDRTAVPLMGAFGYLHPHEYPVGSAIYSWISFLPPEAVEALGGVERVRADAPVAWLEPVELERGPGVLAQLDEDPAASEPARWAEWAGYLEPVLPPRRPEHAFYRLYPDWVLPEHRMERPFPRREDTPPQ